MESSIERSLSEIAEWELKRFLAWAAERARHRSDLALLRAVRAYQQSRGIHYPRQT
jgi:hypothetical protein